MKAFMKSGLLIVMLGLASLLYAEVQVNDQVVQPKAKNLQELLERVKQERSRKQAENLAREKRFLEERNKQQRRLEEARKQHQNTNQQAAPLLARTEANKKKIENLQLALQQKTQDLGDLQAAYRQFAGDISAALNQSMITATLPDRKVELDRLAALSTMPTIQDMESLWLLLQEEMTAVAQIDQFQGELVTAKGEIQQQSILRAGNFTAYTDQGFLRYVPETQELLLLSRQPPSRFQQNVKAYLNSGDPISTMVVDPTKGNLLSMMSYAPDIRERIEQAGTVGLIIIALGMLGMVITLWRSAYLLWVSLQVRKQLMNLPQPSINNPLGRILVGAQSFNVETEENIQFKLDELVLAELPKLERGQSFIKLLAAVAPLLGLLGTVTGMILTFQSISLFGNGDPKLMAGGISQALMTTVLGLIAAIPLLFGHNLVSSLSRSLVQTLDEQSAGLLAQLMEKRDG